MDESVKLAAGVPVGGAGGRVRQFRLGAVDVTVGIVRGAEGTLVVDAGSEVDEGRRIRAGAMRGSGPPVRWAALTHGHWDHVYGASGLGAKVEVYGHAGLTAYLDGRAGPHGTRRAAEGVRAEAVRYGVPSRAAQVAELRLRRPDRVVEPGSPVLLDLGGGVRAELLAMPPAHTGHDLCVVVRGAAEREVVFCGDLVEESGPPSAGADSVLAGWPEALDLLLAVAAPDAVFVPGHGAPVDAAFVRRQRAELAYRQANGNA